MRSLAIVLARSASAKRVPHIGPSPDTLPPSRVVIPRSARTARSLARLWHLVCQPPTRLSLLKPEPVVSSALTICTWDPWVLQPQGQCARNARNQSACQSVTVSQ